MPAESGSYEKFFSWAANEIDTKNNGTARSSSH